MPHSPRLLAARLLDVLENDVIPLTEAGVAKGNKIFGAALLAKKDLSLVLAETNNETENPLWHGEVHLLKRFYERADTREIPTKDLIFLSTHEPCTMCMSAITWAGFDNYVYFFSHEDSRDAFAIPHDLKILKEVYGLEPGGYRQENAYWKAESLPAMIAALPETEGAPLREQAARIRARYDALSASYQKGKDDNAIPLA
jgi:Cytosine/adenosine deaminases